MTVYSVCSVLKNIHPSIKVMLILMSVVCIWNVKFEIQFYKNDVADFVNVWTCALSMFFAEFVIQRKSNIYVPVWFISIKPSTSGQNASYFENKIISFELPLHVLNLIDINMCIHLLWFLSIETALVTRWLDGMPTSEVTPVIIW